MDNFKKYLQQHKDELGEDLPSPKLWQQIETRLEAPVKSISSKNNVLAFFKYAAAACITGLAIVGGWYLLNKNPQTTIASNTAISNPKITEQLTQQPTEKKLVNDSPSITLPTKIIAASSNSNDGINSAQNKITALQLAARQPTKSLNNLQQNQLNNLEANFYQIINIQKTKINTTPLFGESSVYYHDFVDKFKQMEKDEKAVKKDITQLGFTPELMEQLINIYQQKLNVLKLLQTEIQKTNNRFKQNRNAVDTLKTYFIEI